MTSLNVTNFTGQPPSSSDDMRRTGARPAARAVTRSARDENRVDQAGVTGRDDRAGRIGDRDHGDVVGAQQDHVGVLAGREADRKSVV